MFNAYLLHRLLLGIVQLVHIVVYLVKACVLIEVGPQVIHCGQLAHRLAYPCYHKMSQDTVGYPVEADAVIDRVEDQLGRVHEHGVDIGESTLRFLQLAVLCRAMAKIYQLLSAIGTNPLVGSHAKDFGLLISSHDTEVLHLLETMPLIHHHHTDGARPVLLLTYKHDAKVAKFLLASPKSPKKRL